MGVLVKYSVITVSENQFHVGTGFKITALT